LLLSFISVLIEKEKRPGIIGLLLGAATAALFFAKALC
jgi:hypothetical protein